MRDRETVQGIRWLLICCVLLLPHFASYIQGNYKYLAMSANMLNLSDPCTVQLYINRPLLIDGHKFSLRVFALVVSMDPMRLYIFKEGILKLCSAPYAFPNEMNIENSSVHISTFAIHPQSQLPSYFMGNSYSKSTFESTRSLSWLWNWFVGNGYDKDKLWKEIADIVTKTFISVQAPVTQSLRTCKLTGHNKNPFTCFEVSSSPHLSLPLFV